jgi:hypothetical protein
LHSDAGIRSRHTIGNLERTAPATKTTSDWRGNGRGIFQNIPRRSLKRAELLSTRMLPLIWCRERLSTWSVMHFMAS